MDKPITYKQVKKNIIEKLKNSSPRERECIKLMWARTQSIKGFNKYNEKIIIRFD
jgi:hypothetical protein